MSEIPKIAFDVRGGWTSASSAGHDLACPGRYQAQRNIPEPPPDNDQAFGNKVHRALSNSSDTANLNALNAKERDLFDCCRKIEKKLVLDWFGTDHPPMKVWREERKWVRFYGPDKKLYEHSGCADVFFLAGAKGLIIDYKSLAGEVADISENAQIRDNIAMWRGDIMANKGILVECGGAIVQPYVTHSPLIVRYDEPSMDKAAKEMIERVYASHQPNAKRIPGESQCKFCRAKGVCPEYQTWASATLPTFRDIQRLPVEQWEPQQRTIFMDRLPIAQQWLNDTKAAMERGASITSDFVPGYQMRDGVIKTPITDIPELINRIIAAGGTAAGLLTHCGKISKEDLEVYFKGLIKKTVKSTLAQNKAYEELLAGICTPKPNKATLKKL